MRYKTSNFEKNEKESIIIKKTLKLFARVNKNQCRRRRHFDVVNPIYLNNDDDDDPVRRVKK
mgnify:FL=1